MAKTKEQAIWKQYPEYPFIEVNQFGEVRTRDRYVPSKNGSKRLVKGHVLNQYLTKNGYMQVNFRLKGKLVNLLVHRIVAICFIPNPNGYPEVNHKNNDRTNNSVDNLEWCTRKYNDAYKKNFGTTQAEVQGRVLGQPVIAINRETSEVFWFKSQHEAARKLGISVCSVNEVVKGRRYHKTAGGCWFCKADENAVENVKTRFDDEIANKVKKLMNEYHN